MLAVRPQQFDFPRDQISLHSAPNFQLRESEPVLKQEVKKTMFSPYKILLALAVVFMLVMVSFKVYNEFIATPTSSELNSSHDKIIQNADGSSKDKASNSGSSSSKSSKNNEKPNTSSLPASKGPITSNSNLSGSTDSSSNGGSGDEEDDDKDGEKRKKSMDKNRSSTDARSSKYGSSTDDDSESVESENDNEYSNDELIWPTNRDNGPEPLIGSTRK